MEFKIKHREVNIIHYGDRITVKKFALFPVRIDNVRIWLEAYDSVLEWTKGAGHRTYNGYFVQSYADDWVEVKRVKLKKDKETYPSNGGVIIFIKCIFWLILKLFRLLFFKRHKRITKEQAERMIKSLPADWNKWTYRRVIRVRMKDAFYFPGQILKIKYFATFGAFDHKNRWVDYYDIGPEIELNRWRKIWFSITKWF